MLFARSQWIFSSLLHPFVSGTKRSFEDDEIDNSVSKKVLLFGWSLELLWLSHWEILCLWSSSSFSVALARKWMKKLRWLFHSQRGSVSNSLSWFLFFFGPLAEKCLLWCINCFCFLSLSVAVFRAVKMSLLHVKYCLLILSLFKKNFSLFIFLH